MLVCVRLFAQAEGDGQVKRGENTREIALVHAFIEACVAWVDECSTVGVSTTYMTQQAWQAK